MSIVMIPIKCPECGAGLTVENTREFFFCSYCGAKVLLNNENEHIYRKIDEAVISASMKNYRDISYQSILLLYKGAGFTNVTPVPLRNLSLLNQLKNGKVETVTIDGSNDFDEGDVFPKSAHVVITYHSR